MALQSSGAISLDNIATEFGGAQPHSLSEYYRNGGLVTSNNTNVPTSGTISISNFYGAVKIFLFSKTISANTTNYNLRNDMVANGWNSSDPVDVTLTINSGIYVSSNATNIYAFDVDSGTTFPSLSVVSITNNGLIIGMGGNGGEGRGGSFPGPVGSGGGVGFAGGHAFRTASAITMTNNGTIGGGGGGGGGGEGAFVSEKSDTRLYAGGGGGGGRSSINNSSGGAAGTISGAAALHFGGGGGVGTTSGGGSGGGGGGAFGLKAGDGGGGGAYGASGASGGGKNSGQLQSLGGPFSGGSGGNAVVGNVNINWAVFGTRLGAIT